MLRASLSPKLAAFATVNQDCVRQDASLWVLRGRRRRRRQELLNRVEDICGDRGFGAKNRIFEAGDNSPIRIAGRHGAVFVQNAAQIVLVGFMHVGFGGGVFAGRFAVDEGRGSFRCGIQEQDQIRARQAEDFVLHLLDPLFRFRPRRLGSFDQLMGQIGGHIAIANNDFALGQCLAQQLAAFKPIARIEQRSEKGMDLLQRSEAAVQEVADPLPEECLLIAGEAQDGDFLSHRFEGSGQQFRLRSLSRAIDPFDHDQAAGVTP